MFEKNKNYERYIRDEFSFEEKLYEKYVEMRKIIHEFENLKYATSDVYTQSEDFKQGFLAGVKTISSLIIDI